MIERTRCINTPFGAPCTRLLKREVRREWEAKHSDHHIYVWGFDANEADRAKRVEKTLSDYEHEFPLIEHGLTKEQVHGMAWKLGIKRPALYDMGYPNNNCLGCVKGGMGYWNKIRADFPEVFERRAKQERLIGHSCIKGIYLDELDPNRGRVDEIMGDCDIICQLIIGGDNSGKEKRK